MKRSALVLSILVATATAVSAQPAPHSTPTTNATLRKIPVSSGLKNPGRTHATPSTMSGRDCVSGPAGVKAANATNPVNGKAKPAPVVVIPLGRDADTMQNATTRAQQINACAHATH